MSRDSWSMGQSKKSPGERGSLRRAERPPAEGWTLAELAALAGVTPRLVRDYVRRRLLPRPELKGPETRYTRLHLGALLAVRRIRWTEGRSLSGVGAMLAAVPASELEALADARIAQVEGALHGEEAGAALWERFELRPGVILAVRRDADGDAWRVVSAIRALSTR